MGRLKKKSHQFGWADPGAALPVLILGADVVDWLYTHVEGFKDRREARKYASSMLKHGYLRHTVNKITFSEQCYYVFGDLCGSEFRTWEGRAHALSLLCSQNLYDKWVIIPFRLSSETTWKRRMNSSNGALYWGSGKQDLFLVMPQASCLALTLSSQSVNWGWFPLDLWKCCKGTLVPSGEYQDDISSEFWRPGPSNPSPHWVLCPHY